ncbi:MAG: lactoylglutathione lyase [Flavobacteriaceae bacterium]|nr:MAG: lactoylglutathione lyase [Flavobacteriaceae bacterium]
MDKKANIVGWFEIYVDDIDRAKTFYESVFEISEWNDLSNEQLKMFAFPWTENAPFAAGAIVKSDFAKGGVGGTIVYFNCIDCAEEESRVELAGGVVTQSKFSIGEFGFVSMVIDTEGNMIGLHSKD